MLNKLKTQLFLLSMFAMLCVGVTMQYGLWISHQGDAAMHRIRGVYTTVIDPMATVPNENKCITQIESYKHKLVCFKDWKIKHQRIMVEARN